MKKWLAISLFTLVILVGCHAENRENKKVEEEKSMTAHLFGEWEGNIEIPNSPLPIIIKLEETTGTFSVPMQGLDNYPFESIRYNKDAVDIAIKLQGQNISIKGKLADGKIEGTFKQNGATFPVTLTPSPSNHKTKEEITYEQLLIPVEGGELKVALQRAKSSEPSPIAIIVAGSGPTDKNGNSIMGVNSNSYKMLAEQLAEKNIATIRYDKRGIGENTQLVEDLNAVQFYDFAKDISSIIAYVNSHKSFTSVHLIGHSEGALLSTLAAQEQPIDSLILLSGTGRRIDEVMIDQLSKQLSPALVNESKEILEKVKAGEIVKDMSNELKMIFPVQSQPYLTSWINIDPKEELAKVTVPIFIIHGTSDLQLTEKDVVPLRQSADETVIINGMNHILKNSPSEINANLATYTNPSLPLHEELVPTIEKIINK